MKNLTQKKLNSEMAIQHQHTTYKILTQREKLLVAMILTILIWMIVLKQNMTSVAKGWSEKGQTVPGTGSMQSVHWHSFVAKVTRANLQIHIVSSGSGL